jgi:hypothetical protein
MKSYEASSVINADPNQIWAVLTDVSAYPRWDSGVERVEGTVSPGAKIKVFSEANPGRAFAVTVSELVPGERMVWSGGLPLGLFRGVRTYALSPAGDGATEFSMREEYTGPMLPLIWPSIPDLQPSFDKFAAGLKKQAEAASR